MIKSLDEISGLRDLILDEVISLMRDVYFRPAEKTDEDALVNMMVEKGISYSSKGNLYKVQEAYLRVIEKAGYKVHRVEVKNLGDLPAEGRERIKEQCRPTKESRAEALVELRKEFGQIED